MSELDVSEVEKLSEESGLALGRGLVWILTYQYPAYSSKMYGYVCAIFLSSPLLKNIAYTLSFIVLVINCMINPNFQTSGPSVEQVPSRGGPPSSLFRKIKQQYILPLKYANSANFLLFEAIGRLDDLSKEDYSVNLL